jgi:putative hydrolase
MNLDKRIDFHSHTLFSDGILLPAAIAREAEIRGHLALAITDHVDASNLEFVLAGLTKFVREQGKSCPVKILPGVEVSYMVPELIEKYCKKAKRLGAKIIIVHGQSPVEPVYEGTNHVAVQLKGLVNILAHPGNITAEDTKLAAKNGIYLELSARKGHATGNQHVAALAQKFGAKLLVNTDAHSEKDLITQEEAFEIARGAGLLENEAIRAVCDNPKELLAKVSS